ncbi:MAG: ATPase, T2SS/T4P/T4SS family, partial [bacterium]|nr:ATPase, T2SS/T4P/T4SS family [bacterium]
MINIKLYFSEAIKKEASDVHLVGAELPMIRIEGELQPVGDQKLDEKELAVAILEILNKEQKDRYLEEKELDFGYEQDGVRFRVNLHQQDEKIGLAARLIPAIIPNPTDLRFEPVLVSIPDLLDGLVLVTGPTGCGKSTTLASIIEEINKKRKAHIVTIEDPIEF